MASNQYFDWLYPIKDKYRKDKFKDLLLSSLKNDMSKWKVELMKNGYPRYTSPLYGDSFFVIDILTYAEIAYVYHKNPTIPDVKGELIYDNNFSNSCYLALEEMRKKIHTTDVNDIEKLIGGVKESRKDKLNAIEIEQLKPIIEDSYEDWLKEPTEQTAEWIAKIMYSYRKKEDFYNAWLEKFGDIELIMIQLKKLE